MLTGHTNKQLAVHHGILWAMLPVVGIIILIHNLETIIKEDGVASNSKAVGVVNK
jgi:hypothetical protein